MDPDTGKYPVDMAVHEERALWRKKLNRKGNDLKCLEAAMGFLSIYGRLPSIFKLLVLTTI